MRLPPLSLYIHFPWCEQKCPYCDFNSHELNQPLEETVYIDQLLIDLSSQHCFLFGRTVSSIFMGGGTPSLFSPESIERLLVGIKQIVTLTENVEITLEANPGSVESSKFSGYLAAGINRLSIGIQSFQDQKLQSLGRIHTGREAYEAYAIARQCGFENINLDLMHGLPNQSVHDALFDLREAINLNVNHISWYQLTIEPKTIFARNTPILPNDLILGDIEQKGLAMLHDATYARYEISAYARQGFECRHNINYWKFGDYLGIGAGAHGKISETHTGQIFRSSRPRQPRLYLRKNAFKALNRTAVLEADRAAEFLMNTLRLIAGVDFDTYEDYTNMSINTIQEGVKHFQNLGLWQDNKIALTQNGLRHLDSIVAHFL